MFKYDKELLSSYKPSYDLLRKSLLVQQKIGLLNVDMRNAFDDLSRLSDIFAIVETKFSLKIEEIDVEYKDITNRGFDLSRPNLVTSLLDDLMHYRKPMTTEHLEEIASKINTHINTENRYKKSFGIYRVINNKRIKIYEPPLDKNIRTKEFKEVIDKSNKDETLIDMLYTHILFEMIHPFRDGNGRTGRLVLQNSFSKILRDIFVMPISYSLFNNMESYFSSFDIKTHKDIDKSLNIVLEIVSSMCDTVNEFLKYMNEYNERTKDVFDHTSNKITRDLRNEFLYSLQTKPTDISEKFNLNIKTVRTIYKDIADKIGFVSFKIGKQLYYWNASLEKVLNDSFLRFDESVLLNEY